MVDCLWVLMNNMIRGETTACEIGKRMPSDGPDLPIWPLSSLEQHKLLLCSIRVASLNDERHFYLLVEANEFLVRRSRKTHLSIFFH